MTSEKDLQAALLDVRKAYRLVFMFQRRVLDLVAQIADTLALDFWYWRPAGDFQAIQPSLNPLERDPWGMLPLYRASWFFLPPGAEPEAQRKGQWLLEIRVVPDTGFPEEGRGEANPVNFADTTECDSKLELYAYIAPRAMKRNWIFGIYQKSIWPEKDGIAETDDSGIRVVGVRTSLARLADRQAVQALAARFRDMVKNTGGLV